MSHKSHGALNSIQIKLNKFKISFKICAKPFLGDTLSHRNAKINMRYINLYIMIELRCESVRESDFLVPGLATVEPLLHGGTRGPEGPSKA